MRAAVPIVMLSGLMTFFGYWSIATRSPGCPATQPAEQVTTGIHGVGYVEPASETRCLVFKTDGVIACCLAHVGVTYTKGHILMILDNAKQCAEVDVAEKDLGLALAERDKILIGVDAHQVEAARRQVELLGEQLRYRRKEHDRAEALRGKGMLSPSDYDLAFTEMAQCETALLQARAELRHLDQFVRDEDRALAEARVAAARSRLDLAMRHEQDTILAAPCDGTVCEILKHEGEACRTIDLEPALVFGDLTRLRVRAEIDEHYVAKIRSGQSAVIYRRVAGREVVPRPCHIAQGDHGPEDDVFEGGGGAERRRRPAGLHRNRRAVGRTDRFGGRRQDRCRS